jgi:hypothetical protein
VELLSDICPEYGKELLRAESRGHCDGKQDVSEDARRQGYEERWRAAVAEIIGKVGSATRQALGSPPSSEGLPRHAFRALGVKRPEGR